MSGLIKFIFSKTLLVNIILAAGLGLLIFYGTYKWLGTYTHHGESIEVPDLRGMPLEELDDFLAERNLKYQIVDSIFDGTRTGGTVLEQDPAALSRVKVNRTLYLTINAALPPKVKMPDLIDVSFRQAEAILQTFGLKTGDVTYVPDLAKNAVLEQKYKGSGIKPGVEIYKGSSIDLVLGDGMGTTDVVVPHLVGLSYPDALTVLRGASLNPGGVYFDEDIQDSLDAVVYRQEPESGTGITISQGDKIDLYLK
jgi:beta-lactam-binding protein with PASTA domain